jgi:hypothetical protein
VICSIASPARAGARRRSRRRARQAIKVTIPAGLATVGIVGTRLEEWRAAGRGAYDEPGRAMPSSTTAAVSTPR